MTIKDERKDLEKMIENSKNSLEGEMPQETPELQMDPTFSMDFDKTKRNCRRRARSLIKRATGLMLTDDMVKENRYLKNKMEMDVVSLTGLLYQLEVNEMMQETLMEEVRSGAAHPRMFEVFGNLSKTIGDLNKQLLQTVEAVKLTYKDIRGDIREREEELRSLESGNTGVLRREGGLVSMGTKNLIMETRRLKMRDSSIQDIEEIEEIEE